MKKQNKKSIFKAKKKSDPTYLFEVMVIADFCLHQTERLREIVESTNSKSLKSQVENIEKRLANLYQMSGKLYFEKTK